MSSAPAVMVSSTFYDLRQIRADLAHFIADELGYIPLLSELPSFPIDPDLDTIENCRARVEKDASILVLIIGGRYGSIDDKSDKSITNLEFLSARQKGIPIYVFVDRSVLAVMPTWENNRTGDFSATVDTPRVFEFINEVRNQERVWTSQFETPQDIIGTLRRQFAYLLSDALRTRLRLNGGGLPGFLDTLGPKALSIALEKPAGWEYRLFLHSWIDEVENRSDLLWAYQFGLTMDLAEHIPGLSAPTWTLTRIHELKLLVGSANKLLDSATEKAFGATGQAGDLRRIVWISKMLGSVLDGILRWARNVRCAKLESPFENLGAELSLVVDDLIQQFQSFPVASLTKVEEAIARSESGQPQRLELIMHLRLANVDGVVKALDAACDRLGP